MNNSKYIFSLFLLMIGSVCCLGQKAGKEVYRIDNELFGKIAEKIASEYIPDDKVNQANYRVALEDAYNVYQRDKQVKIFWRNDTIELLNKEIELLNQAFAEKQEELSKFYTDSLCQVNIVLDSLQKERDTLLKQLSGLRNDSLIAISKFDESLKILTSKKREQEMELDSLKKMYSMICQEGDELEKEEKKLEGNRDKINQASKKVSDQRKVHAVCRTKLLDALTTCRSLNLLDIEGKKYFPLLEEFTDLKEQIRVISPEINNEMQEKTTQLNDYIQLSDVLKAAIEQMSGKYVENSNLQYAEEIVKYKKKLQKTLTERQIRELNKIYDDLINENNAYQHFCEMLNELQEEYICIVDNTERMRIKEDDFFNKQIERFTHGTKQNPPYCSYYKLLNEAFLKIRKDLDVDSQTLPNESVNTEEKFKEYLSKIKSNL